MITRPESVTKGRAPTASGARTLADHSLWIDKHAPQTTEELVVNKKKVKEFSEIAEGTGGFLVLHGTPGSCKNAMIRAYCLQNRVRLVNHSDIKTHHLDDVYGARQTVAGVEKLAQYPDDLENLIAFIRRQANSGVSTRAKPAFSSFAKGPGNALSTARHSQFSPSSGTRDPGVSGSQLSTNLQCERTISLI